ncbi:hypothetical protein ACOKM5_43385 [Streptomyces sp. BH097]|uniref:hypothetical protein n=1 Tax=unclassified Streptomyces TaxID=2593676 RepID=UPI003BB6BCDA
MGITDTSIAAASALLSGVAALASWRSSREANNTAATIAQIERDRWHHELTPVLRLKLDEGHGHLLVRSDGPANLEIVEVELHVKDDRDRSQDPVLAGGASPEEIAATIWGPYRFRPGVDGTLREGRMAGDFRLDVDDVRRIAVDPTLKPAWYEGVEGEQRWRDQYSNHNFRLLILCTARGFNPWFLSAEVPRNGAWIQAGVPVSLPDD